MKLNRKVITGILCITLVITASGCGADSEKDNILTISNGVITYGPDDIVPAKTSLTEDLKKAGYTITEHTSVDGSDLTIDRVIAKKGNKFIDIVYGMNTEDAQEIFKIYRDLYDDYYILARNENYVYCVSDKKTFSKAGFTSTSNVGEQYIND